MTTPALVNDFDKSGINEYDLVLMNIQGIEQNKADQIHIDYGCSPVNFLCLTETWLKEAEIGTIHIDGFHLETFFCRKNSIRGGVAIWVKNSISTKLIDLQKFTVELDIEICGLVWNTAENRTVYVINCYRSPNGNVDVFVNNLEKILYQIFKPNCSIILCGDFNAHTMSLSGKSMFFSLMETYNLHNNVEDPTRIQNGCASILDLIFTNYSNNTKAKVVNNTVSDHETVLFKANLKPLLDRTSYHSRNYNEININTFISDLSTEQWTGVWGTPGGIDKKFDVFYSIYLYYFNTNFPIKKRYKNITRKQWVSEPLRNSSRELKRLHFLQKRGFISHDEYNLKKNAHKKLINSTKKQYYEEKLLKSDNHNKTAWAIVSELSGKNKHIKNLEIKDNNDCVIINPKEMANFMNSSFIEAPNKIISEIKRSSQMNEKSFLISKKRHCGSMFLNSFTAQEVLELIKNKIKNKHSYGPDNVPFQIFKKCANALLEPLAYLINLSFEEGIFPTALKMSRVTPIFKKGDSHLVENYRPIAITSCFSKVFEYAMLDRLSDYLNKQKIMHENQHGFTVGKSTSTAIHAFLERVIDCIESKEHPAGIFCDISKAFDCMNHDILLKRMEEYGIRGLVLDWFKSFLTYRKQFVEIRQKQRTITSEVLSVERGVPQGTILGPILFVVFINELAGHLPELQLTEFADDCTALVSSDCVQTLEERINSALLNLNSWFNTNELLLNVQKTNLVVFHSSQNNKTLNLNVHSNGETIERQKHVKFLGLELDENLSWEMQCKILSSKLNTYNFLIRNLRTVLNQKCLLSFYYAQIYSRLVYGILFWGNSSHMISVFKSQKKIVRCIAGTSPRSSCRILFENLKILPLPCIYILEVCLWVYKNKLKLQKNKDLHNYNTRNKDCFVLEKNRLESSKKYFTSVGVKVFNKLPNNLKIEYDNINVFKRKLKNLLLQKCFYSLNEYFVCTFM